MNTYERGCRRLLLAYPRAWREERGDEVVAVLSDLHEQEWGRDGSEVLGPTLGTCVDLVSHGLEARWDRLWSSFSTVVRDRFAVLSLVLGAAVCTVALVFGEVNWPWLPPLVRYADGPRTPLVEGSGPVLYGVWLAAFALVLAGRERGARWLLAGFAAGVVFLLTVGGFPHPPGSVIGPLALAALLGSAGRLPVGRSARGWTALAFVVTTASLSLAHLAVPNSGARVDRTLYFYLGGNMAWVATCVVLLLIVAGVVSAVAALRGARWFLAVLVTALPYAYLLALILVGEHPVDRAVRAVVLVSAVPFLLAAGALWSRRAFARGQDRLTTTGPVVSRTGPS